MAVASRVTPEPGADKPGSSSALAFLVFLIVPLAVVTAELAIVLCLGLVWTDLLHVNPHRTTSNVLTMMALSPLYGLFGALFLAGAPILLGAVLASIAVAISGRLSPATVACIVVLGTALFISGCFVGSDAFSEDPDPKQAGPPWSTLIAGPLVLTLSWLGGRSAFLRLAAK